MSEICLLKILRSCPKGLKNILLTAWETTVFSINDMLWLTFTLYVTPSKQVFT